jgi:hypothetical protein
VDPTLTGQPTEIRVSAHEFRVDAGGPCTVRGPVYPSFDPVAGGSYTVDEILKYVDGWGTYITEADVRKLVDDYMIRSQFVDRMHNNEHPAGRVVEATVRGPDGDFGTPTWYGGVRVDPAVESDVRGGKLRGFSIEVYAGRQRIEVTVRGTGEVPDLTGVTQAPWRPNYVKVDGERRISIDRLTGIKPVAKSLVDRPAIRQEFAITRSEAVLRFAAQEDPVTMPATPAPTESPATANAPAPTGEQRADGGAAATQQPASAPAATPTPVTRRVIPLADAVKATAAQVLRFMQPGAPLPTEAGREARAEGEAPSWGATWEVQEVWTNFNSMLYLLYDFLCWRFLWNGEITADNLEATIQSAAKDCSEFLGEVRELFTRSFANVEEKEAMLVEAREMMLARAIGSLSPEVLARAFPMEPVAEGGTEQRAGKKYSAKTMERMEKALAGCEGAATHLREMLDEAKGATDEGGDGSEKKNAPATPVVAVPPVPTAAERQLREVRALLARQTAEIAALRSAPGTPVPAMVPAPAAEARSAPPVTPAAAQPTLEQTVAELRAAAEANARRLAEIAETRRPSAQPTNDGIGAPAAPAHEPSAEELAAQQRAKEERFRDQLRFGTAG